MTNDGDLLRSYAETGDEAAFTELVGRHVGMLHGAATRLLGDAHGAHDVVQSVFVLLARQAPRLHTHPCLAGWLHLAVVNRVRDLRKAALRQARREEAAAVMSQADDPSAQRLWEQVRPVIDEALATLRPEERAALVLRYFEGQTLAEVGARLQTTEDAARMRIQRALTRLGPRLRQAGITSLASAALLSDALAAGTQAGAAAAPASLASSVSAAALAEVGATSAAATVGGVVALGTFMAVIKTTGLGLVAAAAVGWATWEHHALHAAQTAPRATAPLDPTTTSATGKSEATSAPPTGKSYEQRQAEAKARGDALLAAHPELRATFDNYVRTYVLQQYRRFLVIHPLTDEQRAKFETIMIDNTTYGLSFLGQTEDETVSFRKLKAIKNNVRDTRLLELLGETGFKAWAETGSAASWMDSKLRTVIAALMDSDAPLTTAEAKVISQLLETEFQNTKATGGNVTTAWDGVMAATKDLPSAARDALGALRASDLLDAATAAAAKAALIKPQARP